MSTLKAEGQEFILADPAHFLHRNSAGTEQRFFYDDKLRLCAPALSGDLLVRHARSSASLAPLSPAQVAEFLPAFFRAWKNAAPEAATKAAFDYVDAQRGFTSVALVSCLVLGLPVAVALLADSQQQFSCTRELQASAVPGEIRVVKATKKDSRSFKIRMEFQAPNGQLIKAEDLVRTRDEKDIPKALPIFYSPERPLCWSLTKGLDSQEIPWAKRRYFAWFTMLFGFFFLGASLLGMAWAVLTRTRARPAVEEIRAIFAFK